MKNRVNWTTPIKKRLSELVKTHTVKAATQVINAEFGQALSIKTVKSAKTRFNIKSEGRLKDKIGFSAVSQKYSAAHTDWLRTHYPLMRLPALTQAFNRQFNNNITASGIRGVLTRNKIHCGRDGTFKPGQAKVPGSGAKGPNKTSFKKGHTPANKRGIGSEFTSQKDGYTMVKVSDTNPWPSSTGGWYRQKHVILWEQRHGPVPNKHLIIFKDGNKQNITLDNLQCISKAEHMKRNSVHRWGPEVAQLCQLKGAINRQINKMEKQHEK